VLILNSFIIFNVCNFQCITAQLSTSTITPSTTKGNTVMSLIKYQSYMSCIYSTARDKSEGTFVA